jgi:hypothetical protein
VHEFDKKNLGFLASNSPQDAYSDLHFETSEGSFFNSSRTAGDRVPSRGVFIEGERHMRFLHLKKGLLQKAFQARYEHRGPPIDGVAGGVRGTGNSRIDERRRC